VAHNYYSVCYPYQASGNLPTVDVALPLVSRNILESQTQQYPANRLSAQHYQEKEFWIVSIQTIQEGSLFATETGLKLSEDVSYHISGNSPKARTLREKPLPFTRCWM
jgi:hypothetical protein